MSSEFSVNFVAASWFQASRVLIDGMAEVRSALTRGDGEEAEAAISLVLSRLALWPWGILPSHPVAERSRTAVIISNLITVSPPQLKSTRERSPAHVRERSKNGIIKSPDSYICGFLFLAGGPAEVAGRRSGHQTWKFVLLFRCNAKRV